jgi:hypothetical protein
MVTVTKRGTSYFVMVSLGYVANPETDKRTQIRKTSTFVPPEGTRAKTAEKLAQAFAADFERKCRGLYDFN